MPRIVRKFGVMLVSGVAFGLAASLVFIGVLKASGIEDKLAALDSAQTIGETVMSQRRCPHHICPGVIISGIL